MDIDDDILIQKYETLLYNRESMYFDSEEFCTIISYYVSENRYADALEALIRAELCYPDDMELALYKVRIMMFLDNFDRAFELLQDLESRACDSFEINLYKGHIYTLNDDIENAVREFELVLEKNPDLDDEELQYIPSILMEQGYCEEALIFLHKFIDYGIASAKIFFNTAHCYEHINNSEKAEEYYEKSLDEDPFSERTWVILGLFHLNHDNAKKALEAFEFALSINNNTQIAFLCKSAALIQSGDYGKAIECLLDGMSKSLGERSPLSDIAGILNPFNDMEDMEDMEEDESEFEEEKDFEVPYWGLSKVLYAQGNIESAIHVLNKAIELDPDNEDYLYFRGQCIISLISNRKALENILQNSDILKESNPDDSEFVSKHKKAVFSYKIDDLEECCKYLLEAFVINSEGLEMFFNTCPKAKDDAYIIIYLGKHLK